MAGIDKTTGRTVAVIVLLVLTAAALRGYLPDTPRAPREPDSGGPATLFAVSAMLAASLVIVAIAIISRLRERETAPPPAALPEALGGGIRRRPPWRLLLIGLGAIIVWLVLVLLFARLGAPADIGETPVPDNGSTTATPTEPPGQSLPPPQTQPEADGSILGFRLAFLVTTVAFLAVLVTGTVAAKRHRRSVPSVQRFAGDDYQVPVADSGPESLVRAAELGLAEMDDVSRGPREAIIACYAAMERALADAPGAVPQDSDTPSEVLARAVEHHALRADSATQLVDLFTEARFSPHVMNDQHREIAVRVLRRVRADLGSSV